MDPKLPSGRQVFDFETNSWVLADGFNARAEGREIVLNAPTTAPAEGRWTKIARRQAPTGALSIALAWTAVALFVVGLVLHSLVPLVGTVVCVLAVAALGDARNHDDLRVTDADRMLLEDPDDLDVCLVALTVMRDGRVVGRDKGVVWFADGMLLYNGHRTSFAIGGEDVLPRAQWPVSTSGLEPDERKVPLRVARGTATITVTPLVGSEGSSPNEMRFLKRLYAFRRRPPVSKGPRQWPPFES